MQMHDFVDTPTAARMLGVSRTTLTRWVAADKIQPALTVPGYRGRFLFDRAAVEAVAAARAE